MNMSFGQILQDLQGAFVHSTGYIKKDSLQIRQHVQERLAETNCKRILAVTPGLILIAVIFLQSLRGWFISMT